MKEYERYMLFWYYDYEGIGGIYDCKFTSGNIQDCYNKLLERLDWCGKLRCKVYDNFHIFDRVKGELFDKQEIYIQVLKPELDNNGKQRR